MPMSFVAQTPYRCKHDWGPHGVREAASRGEIIVVVDTLSYSTAVITAVAQGALVFPARMEEDAGLLARRVGAELAVNRRDVPTRGRFSLSPSTLRAAGPGTRIILASPNGATCSRYAGDVPYLFIGAPVNASAVAGAVNQLLASTELNCTVISAGERWKDDGALRPAIEDYLGAGAILSRLYGEKSPEARLCQVAYEGLAGELEAVIWDCASGRELREVGFARDVRDAAEVDRYSVVPVMQDGAFMQYERGTLWPGATTE